MLRLSILLFITISTFAGGTKLSPEALKLVKAYNEFALKSYQSTEATENTIYSPYSLASLLHMSSSGANDETYDEFAKVLGLEESNLKQVNELLRYLKTREHAGLITGRAAALQSDYPLKLDFVKSLEKTFFSKIFSLDLRGQVKQSCKVLNDWIEKQTRGYVRRMIPESILSQNIVMILLSTSYFKGKWTTPFPLSNTRPRSFKLENGETKKVQTMYNDIYVGSLKEKNKAYQLASLRFKYYTAMNFYLPSKDQKILEFEQKLKAKDLIHKKLNWDESEVYLPKFKFQRSYEMKKMLQKLGLKKAFDLEEANFDKVSRIPTYISQFYQKAGVIVEEKGVVAYGADFGEFDDFGEPPELKIIKLNRPFFFTIVDQPSGLILFMGRVTDPSQR